MLHHRIIDGVRWRSLKRSSTWTQVFVSVIRLFVRQDTRRVHLRLELFESGKPYRRTHDEDAAVPPEVTGRNVLRGEFGGRLFNKTVDAMGAVFQSAPEADIAKAGIRPCRRNAERGDLAGLRVTRGGIDGGMKRRHVRYRVVGGHGYKDR